MVLIAIIVMFIGAIGWFLYTRQSSGENEIGTEVSTNQEVGERYERTTTVPSDWKTYSNEKYKISLAYPPDWTLTENLFTKKVGESVQNSYSSDATEIFVICYQPKGLTQVCANQININNQPLADSLVELRQYNSNYRPATERVLSIDGHSAFEFSLQDEKEYFVGANGYTYGLPKVVSKELSNGDGIESLTPEDSLIMFESIKID